MLWQASNEVMLDMWRARFGNERVDFRILYDEKAGGDTNDWPYVARALWAIAVLTRHEPINAPGVFYQLKEIT
jgi:hypothetical protein